MKISSTTEQQGSRVSDEEDDEDVDDEGEVVDDDGEEEDDSEEEEGSEEEEDSDEEEGVMSPSVQALRRQNWVNSLGIRWGIRVRIEALGSFPLLRPSRFFRHKSANSLLVDCLIDVVRLTTGIVYSPDVVMGPMTEPLHPYRLV
jgi:hypothetical protein